jgi:SAM-dependent methyltransferase
LAAALTMPARDDSPKNFIPGLGPDAYADWRRSGIGAITEQLERKLVLELIGDVSGSKLLDLGCGDGKLAVELARRGACVTAVDASPSMIDAARARAAEEGANIRFAIATANALPFPAEEFDTVTAVTILCFVDDAKPVFDEIARVLRPRGRLVIGELGKWSSWAAMRRLRGWLGSAMWRKGRFRTASQLKALAENSGLSAEPVRGAIYYPRWQWAARLLAPRDERISRITTIGAAFLALRARKP